MIAFNRMKLFLSLDFKMKCLFLEAFIFLGWARILKSKQFAKVAPSLGNRMNETSFSLNEEDKHLIRNISQAVNSMSHYTVWESKCLVRAIAGMKMLERRKIDSTLYLGTAKDEKGDLIAHAWLRSGPFYLTGADEMKKFTVVAKFAKVVSEAKTKRRIQ